MATYLVATPDGALYTIKATDSQAATETIRQLTGKSPSNVAEVQSR